MFGDDSPAPKVERATVAGQRFSRRSIQEGYKTSTGAEHQFFGEKLDVMADLDDDREVRLIEVRTGLPSILWVALIVLGTSLIGLAYLIGMESRQLQQPFELLLHEIGGK